MADDKLKTAPDQAALKIPTGWKNPPELSDLKNDYEDAQNHHSAHVSSVNTWLDNLHIRGAAKPVKRTGRSGVQPQLIRKQAEWRYAALSEPFLSAEDIYTTEPVTFEDKDAAVQNGLILNNQFNTQINKTQFIDNYVRAAVDEGSVIVRVGWEYEDEDIEVPNLVPTPIEEPFKRQLVEQGVSMIMENPEAAAEQLPPELMETIQLSLEMQEMVELLPDPNQPTKIEQKIITNQPTVEVCDYKTTIIDPLCKGDIDKAQFVIWEYETSLGELMKYGDYQTADDDESETESRYHNLKYINLEGAAVTSKSTVSNEEDDAGGFNFTDEARKKITAYEYWGYWDIDNTGIPQAIVSTWVGDVMIRLERSPFPDNRLPFVLIQYLPKTRSVYGEPDGALLIENQQIIGAVTRGMIDIMGRSAVGQIGYRKDALDVTNQRRFEAGKDYSFNPQVDPRLAFHTHIFPEIPSSAPFMIQMENNDAEAMTGVKSFNDGITGEGLGRSATAARSAMDAAGKRELGILRRLAKGVTDIGRKMMAMNGIFLSEQEIIRITNEEFVTIDREDLAGNIDIRLNITTAEADNAKAQELAFMLQTNGPQSDPGEVRMIRAEIARLRKMPALAKQIEEYQPQPDPLAVKKAELEIGLLEAQIRETDSKTAENYAEAEENMASVRNKDASTDKTNLDYMEQESGTTQARNKEMAGEQGRVNQDLEITKSLLKRGEEREKVDKKESTDGGN